MLLAFVGAGALAQQEAPTAPVGDVFASQGEPIYSDAFSSSCEKGNNSPYAGMNPLVCYGVMAPTDSAGKCTLGAGVMKVWKQEGGTCYYCQPINPPIKGFIVPFDDIAATERQGFECGVDQADPNCSAVCQGSGTFTPPPGTTPLGSPGVPQSAAPPTPTKPILKGRITNEPDPCEPFGPGGYDYCKNPMQPPGCVCPKSEPRKPAAEPSIPVTNTVQYLQGMAAGMGNCIQGIGSLISGLGYFAQGDFVNAAKSWGVTPGDSVTLKAIAAELTTPVVGSNVTSYDQGVAAGRRICSYVLVPGAAKAAGTAIKGAGAAAGASAKTPIQGSALQNAINDAPETIANKPVQLQNGVAQLGDYVNKGSFADVFKFGKASVIKLSRTADDAAGYGPASIEGQLNGFNHLKAAGIDTPELSDFQPGNADTPASIVADDVTKKYPGSFQLSRETYNKMAPALQTKIASAIQDLSNELTNKGLGLVDSNPGNLTMQAVGNDFKAIIHDTDMIYNKGELDNLVNGTLPNGMIPKGVLDWGLKMGGASDLLSGPWTLETVMETIQKARMQQLLPPEGRIPTVPPQMNIPSGTVVPQ
jgi:hypothetical protein